MASVLTTITPKLFKVPFTGPPDIARRGSTIARAELLFTVNSGDWPAPGTGNDKRLDIDLDLPKDFAYLCTDLSLMIEGASGGFVYANNHGDIQFNSDPSTNGSAPDYRLLKSEFWSGTDPGYTGPTTTVANSIVRNESQIIGTDASDTLTTRKIYAPQSLPGYLLFPYTDTRYQSTVKVKLESVLDADGANSFFFFARFVQYDIAQAYNWAPGSPVL